jgi:Outer membrane lipoprotein-sorting protein
MNKNSRRTMNKSILVISACACAAFCLPTLSFAADPTPDALKIMADVYKQDINHDITMKASFQVFDQQGHSTKKDFILRRIGSPGDTKTEVVFTAPKEIRGVALLSINQPGVSERQYVYTPATQRVRSVVPQERSVRFIGTDFTFEDIGERVLGDFTYRVIGVAETLEGHKTYKVEATPVDSSRSQYKFTYYWVAQDVPVVLFAEMYDAQGQKVRVLHATDIKRAGGVWGARHTEMRTVQDGTRTVLTIDEVKFNTNPDEKLFAPQGLADALGSGNSK